MARPRNPREDGRHRRCASPATRKALARRYGMGGPSVVMVACHYCGKLGAVWWVPAGYRRKPSGRSAPSTVYFDHHIEHVVPWDQGGSDDIDNLVLACPPCNLDKGARTPAEWKAVA